MTVLLTQAEIANQYINNIEALNPLTNPKVVGTDWWIKAQIQGGVVSGIYQQAYNLQQAVFIQYASGILLDYYLASYGLNPRLGASPATGYAIITVAPTANGTVPANTILTLSGGLTYITTAAYSYTTVSYGELIPIQSQSTGIGTGLYNGTEINFSPTLTGGVAFLVVQTMNDGSNAETDTAIRLRLLGALNIPKTGGSETDYFNWCLSQTDITYAYLRTNNVEPNNTLSIYLMSGSGDVDNILQNVPFGSYSRVTTITDIENATNYVLTVKPLFDFLSFNTVYTYIVNNTDSFAISNILLISGITSSTILPGFTITVDELIRQELRRAVLSTPLGGTLIGGLNYMIHRALSGALYESLNSTDGTYAQILIDFDLTFNGTDTNILVPDTVDGSGAYPAVYDINNTNLTTVYI